MVKSKSACDVIVVATAIKTEFWKEFYLNLKKNNATFHLIFSGPRPPDFSLPSNFTYIHSDLKPAACVEICYRYAKNHIKGKYIMHTADDFLFQPGYLDSLIKGYKKKKRKYNSRPLMITQLSIAPNGSRDMMAKNQGDPLLGIGPFTTFENHLMIGGVDKRFTTVCWDMDRVYRFYELGGIMIPLDETECPTVKERPNSNNTQWALYGKSDLKVMDDLWQNSESPHEGEIVLCKYEQGSNVFFGGSFQYSRTGEVLEYTDEELHLDVE